MDLQSALLREFPEFDLTGSVTLLDNRPSRVDGVNWDTWMGMKDGKIMAVRVVKSSRLEKKGLSDVCEFYYHPSKPFSKHQ